MKKVWYKKMKKVVMAWLLVLSMIVPTFVVGGTAEAAEAANSGMKDYNAMSIEDILNVNESLTWVFAGDSITHNGSWSQGMNSYSEWFEQYLYDINRDDDAVINTAWGGADIYDFQYDGENTPGTNANGAENNPGMGLKNMITKYNPDIVFIKLGMNDRGKSNAEIKKYYEMMLDGVYAEGRNNQKIPKIIMLSPTPLSGENLYDDMVNPNPAEAIQDNTLRIKNLLEGIAKDKGLLFCDLRTAFLKEQLRLGADYRRTLFSDPSDGGIHPNAAGQYLIFKTLSKVLGIYDKTKEVYQLEYDDADSAALYVDGTDGVKYTGEYDKTGTERTFAWIDTVKEVEVGENAYVWAVLGAEQMSGYEGPVVNRSLFRLLDNVMRGGGSDRASMRDIRLINFAKPGNTVAEMYENYDITVGEHGHNVLLVLPEVSQVYADNYQHSADLVANYKTAIKNLIAKENGIVILWTPLASSDATLNGYITDYANAVREIAVEDTSLLFFDANKFMNENMANNEVLTRNWFEEDMYVSPLCVVDLVRSFYETTGLQNTGLGEVTSHTLRLTSDKRVFRGNYVRDYISSNAIVNGTEIAIDVSAIKAAYGNDIELQFDVMPSVGAGNFNKDRYKLNATESNNGNTYTFEAPCKNPVIAIYGNVGNNIYRFKDVEVKVDTTATIDRTSNPNGVYLDSLEVVGAPALDFNKDKTTYDVTLYQYQQFVQINAGAQEGLKITVDGEAVEAGENSQLITVDKNKTVKVKVSYGSTEKTYTLNLTRPEYPDIIITEVMQDGYNQNGGDNYELIEIYNASGRELNLKDYSIGYKKDYRYSGLGVTVESPNYYFTGNNLAFQSTSGTGAQVTYTGINQITKYSSYWENGVTEPEKISFPADSTMVIWVKFSPGANEAYGERLTYDTLIADLQAHKDTHTLSVNGEAVVPSLEQLVVAEVPKGVIPGGMKSTANNLASSSPDNFYMDNHGAENQGSGTRSWLFILKAGAEKAVNGAITEAGNDIVSALKQARLASTDKLSSVFFYNVDRGMSLVKDEGKYDATTVGEGHTSSEQGYSNKTSFGAIEYWQKPINFADKKAPVVSNTTPTQVNAGTQTDIKLSMSDETDLRYVELYVMKEGEIEWTKVTSDYVLESCVANGGITKNVVDSKTFTYGLGEVTNTIQYYAIVSDGNNIVEIGSKENPLEVNPIEQTTSSGEIGEEKVVTVGGQAVTVINGDVTDDGKVNITDFMKLRAYLIGKAQLDEKHLKAGDVSGDARVSIVDFMRIRAYLIK